MCSDLIISDFRSCADPLSSGTTSQGLSYEVYELKGQHAEPISMATLCASGVIDKHPEQIIDHFENGGTGFAVFINNYFAGQVLIKDNDMDASAIQFSPADRGNRMMDISSGHTIKISTVSSIAPTPHPDHQVKGYSFPLMDVWYEHAVANKCHLLQGCVQIENTKGYNMFRRNQFVTDDIFYPSPNGGHNVYFMYRSVVASAEFDTRHQSENETSSHAPFPVRAMNCC